MSQDQVIVVFTDESAERILLKGGTSAWRLKPNHARQCSYVLCTRNVNGNGGRGPVEHYTGFLMGKLADVVSVPGSHNGDRYLAQFSEYAHVNIPDAWNKGDRNPIRYSALEEIAVDASSLKWKPMPAPAESGGNSEPSERPALAALTLQEAKMGLAVTFGVKPEAIEITIRA